jgi:flagellar assembly factor FliW
MGVNMLINTKHFGEIDLDESKILTFDNGIMGFEEYKKYTILYDIEEGNKPSISWFQSLDIPDLAIPIINPLLVKTDYNPTVEDEVLKPLGDITEDNLVLFVTLTVPTDLTKMTVNLKAPIIINSDTRRGCQLIVENQDYGVKYGVYDIIQKMKGEK